MTFGARIEIVRLWWSMAWWRIRGTLLFARAGIHNLPITVFWILLTRWKSGPK